jgi:hypothetical protein
LGIADVEFLGDLVNGEEAPSGFRSVGHGDILGVFGEREASSC